MFLNRDAMNMMVLGHLINYMITTNLRVSLPLAGEMDCHTNHVENPLKLRSDMQAAIHSGSTAAHHIVI